MEGTFSRRIKHVTQYYDGNNIRKTDGKAVLDGRAPKLKEYAMDPSNVSESVSNKGKPEKISLIDMAGKINEA